MAKSAWEKALEKQAKEEKKRAEMKARRDRASSIVSGQPMVGGMRIMDRAAEEVLGVLLKQYDGNERRVVQGNYDVFPAAYHCSLLLEFEKLNMYGVAVNSHMWIGSMWEITLTPQGLSYFEDKEKAMEKETVSGYSVNIEKIIATGSNIVVGNAAGANLSIDNSISNLEKEIEEKGGEDAEELKELLGEVKELIENIEESRHIPKNKGLFAKISAHLEKHGWFYGEVVGLLGTAAMKLLQG